MISLPLHYTSRIILFFNPLIAFFATLVLIFMQPAMVYASGQDGYVFDAKERFLDNGLQVIVVENHRSPVVGQMLWYKVGAIDEGVGQSGLAHFLEHLMFKGSNGLAPGEFSRKVRQYGGRDNAFTSWDYTAYFQTIPSDQLDQVMAMEAGRMRGLTPPLSAVESERDVVIQERKQVLDSNPMAQLSERMRQALYVNHAYGRPIIGWMPDIESLNWQQAKDFYDYFYRPDNAVLIISGAVKADDVFAMADRHFGSILNPDTPVQRHRSIIPDTRVRPHILLENETVSQPVWMIKGLAPSWAEDKVSSLALQIVDNWLAGSEGPLYQAFVVEKQLASGISFSYVPLAIGSSSWSVGLWPQTDMAPDMLQSALSVFLDNLQIDETRLKTVVSRMQDASVYERDSLIGPAMTIGHVLAAGGSLRDAETWPAMLDNITVAQVNKAIKEHLVSRAHTVTGLLTAGRGDE